MDGERCETCKFWDGCEEIGRCRRYPPSMPSEADRPEWYPDTDHYKLDPFNDFPITKPGEWCGEWQAKRTQLPVAPPEGNP